MAWGPITSWQTDGEKMETMTNFLFLGYKITVGGDCSHEIRRCFLGRKAATKLDSVLKNKDITLLAKICIVKAMVFQVVMYRYENWMREGRVPKNWCFRTVVLKKTLESPWDSKEIKPINSKGNQPWIFIGKTDTEAEVLMLCSLDVKSWLIGKKSDARKDRREEEKATTEDEIVGWHHQWT